VDKSLYSRSINLHTHSVVDKFESVCVAQTAVAVNLCLTHTLFFFTFHC